MNEITNTLNSVSQIQLIETIAHFVRLCDLFSYHPFKREVISVFLFDEFIIPIALIYGLQTYSSVIDHHPLKQKLQNRITSGISQCITDIDQYIETTWFRFRQLWEVDQESFIAVYESEHTDLQGLEGDIAR